MQRFEKFNEERLLDALTGCYQHYRELLVQGGTEVDFASCKLQLMAILEELNKRRKFWETEKRTTNFYDREPDKR
jgi:hypothetical protein